MKEHIISGSIYDVKTVNIDYIKDSDNIRLDCNDVSDLAASIKEHGILHPLTVTEDKNTLGLYYKLVAGHRRLAAAKINGLKEVPCHVIKEQSKAALVEIALTENVSRMDMTAYEECLAVKALSTKKNTPLQIAKRFGRSLRWVLTRKKLADAGETVLEKVKNNQIPLSLANRLADLPDETFKEELESRRGTLEEYDVKSILERYHKELSKAPFDTSACLQCQNCSACQTDLFDTDQKAICLNPDCWDKKIHEAYESRVSELESDGIKISPNNEWNYRIQSYKQDELKKAEDAGIKKRVYIDPETLKETEYYDERDLPDYVEESEEEKKERINAQRRENNITNKQESLWKDAIREKIADAIQHGPATHMIALLAMTANCCDCAFNEDEVSMLTGIDKDSDDFDEYPDPKQLKEDITPSIIATSALHSVHVVIDSVYSMDNLKAIYRIFCNGDIEKLMPSREEAEKALDEKDNDED